MKLRRFNYFSPINNTYMKIVSPKSITVIYCLYLIIGFLSVGKGSIATLGDYSITKNDTFIWEFIDVDIIENHYFTKFSVSGIFANSTILGNIETYFPLNDTIITQNMTEDDVFNLNYNFLFFPVFLLFDNNFNFPIFYNNSQLQIFEDLGYEGDEFRLESSMVESFHFAEEGYNIWIAQSNGVTLKIDYLNLLSFQLISTHDEDLKPFAENYLTEDKIQWIYLILISVCITGIIISTHLYIRKRKLNTLLKNSM